MTGRVPSDMPPVAPALVIAVYCSSRDRVRRVCMMGATSGTWVRQPLLDGEKRHLNSVEPIQRSGGRV
jgi:hypothetical protein